MKHRFIARATLPFAIGALALTLAACGSDSTPAPRGEVLGAPTPTATLAKAQVDASATSAGISSLAGPAACDVSVSSVSYRTVGGANEDTNATAAVMVPTGTTAACSGARPILLYAHGTTADRRKNMANPADGEAALLVAFFAAQGFIVVAPNYAGYDASALPYHPYLNADQQSADMVDALRAAKAVLPSLGATASNRLVVTGYSQGGHVAMATHRAIEQSYAGEFSVTASGPMSGPYSLSKMTNAIFAGQQPIGASVFGALLAESYQRSYGNVYSTPSQVYAPPFDTIVPGLLPSNDPSGATARLPAGADGTYRTLFNAGNGQPYLVTDSFKASGVDPASNWSKDVARNDLLGWKPTAPMALCYGAQDPTVFGFNATDAQTAFAARGAAVARYDMEDATTMPTGAAPVKAGFDALKTQISTAAGGGSAGAAAVLGQYHGTIVPPFCTTLVRGFFQQVLAATP